MRKLLVFVCGLMLVFGSVGTGNADLLGIIYDYDLDLWWLNDANYAKTSGYDADGFMTWDKAMAWIDHLNDIELLGFDDWRLPITPGTQWGYVNEGEMGHLYYDEGITYSNPGPFINVQGYPYWSGTELAIFPYHAWRFSFHFGYQDDEYKVSNYCAWAVRPGHVSDPAPEPATMLLLGSGLAGLAVFRRKIGRRHG